MENYEIALLLIPGACGILYGIHLLYFIFTVKKNSSDPVRANAAIAKLFRRHSTPELRRELKCVCSKDRLIDGFLYGRWFWMFPGIVAIITLIVLDN